MHLIYDLKENNSIEMWKYYNMDMQSYVHITQHIRIAYSGSVSLCEWVSVCVSVCVCHTRLLSGSRYMSLPSLSCMSFAVHFQCMLSFDGAVFHPFHIFWYSQQHKTPHCKRTNDTKMSFSRMHFGYTYALFFRYLSLSRNDVLYLIWFFFHSIMKLDLLLV